MAKPEKTVLGSLKKTWVSLMKGVKRLAGAARERVAIDTEFAKTSVRVSRLHKGMVSLNANFLAVFDKEATTLTFREGENLDEGALVEVEDTQYRVQSINRDAVSVSVEVNHRVHRLPCRVATLQRL
jgi:hypothetical protein